MKRLVFSIIIVSLFFALLPLKASDAAVMEDYCQVPPYVIQNVAPNVMIVLDNSGSMFYFSYFDGFNTTTTADDNLCANSASPCTGFTAPGTYPTYKYYGYFNPDYWYVWDNPRFRPAARKTETRPASSWDGNFLNWLTMRRIDVIRKVMTGGKTTSGEGSGYDRLIGEIADCDSRGKYKRINNAQDYTPYSGNRKFYVYSADAGCGGGGSGTSSFGVRNASDGSDGTGNEATFNVAVRVPVPVEGVLQRVVGARARMGLSFYRVNGPTPHGGYVRVNVASGSLLSTVNEINLTRPNSNTPLAETLWMVTGYFAQQASIEGGPGPMYGPSSNYTISNNADPLNYGTGGQPRWPSCSKSFVLYITDGEPCADGYLPGTIRDYASGRSDYNCSGTSCPAVGSFPASTFPSCTGGDESASCGGVVSGCYVAGIEDVALYMHTTDLRSPTLGKNDIPDKQNLTLYAVFAFGKGSTLLRYAAINGGFEDLNGSNTPDQQSEWDNNNDGEPDNFYEATEGSELERAIEEAFLSILKRASSGTAASVLASGEGQGANLVQAVFYPRRRLGNDVIAWTGSLQNLWYHVDPFFIKSSIREETTADNILNLTNDYIAELTFSTSLQTTIAKLYADADGDGVKDNPSTPTATKSFEDLFSLWEAGHLLWSRDISAAPRTIYAPCISGGTCNLTTGMMNFATTEKTTLRPFLQASTDTEAEYIIRYIHGEGLTTVDLDNDGSTDIFGVDLNGDSIDDYRARYVTIGSEKKVWKLGDILNSTPRIASWLQLNKYDTVYNDTTYKSFVDTSDYKSRGMVYTGGNDGMLHAFKLGTLELKWSGQSKPPQMARLTGSDLGKEVWAFVPKNVLPYLKYIMSPDYCHIYTVDLPPQIFDASINGNSGDTKDVNSWRTILIGGMRYGGACRGTTTTCTDVSGDGSKDCVNTPVDVDGASVGYSSYFALDVTDQNNPKLLWEFSHPQLGFATTNPTTVRIGQDKTKNGKWFIVFGSGPTGPISTADWQFMGRSDQNLRLFVLDLKTGNTERIIDTGIQYAFAGSMLNASNDSDIDYQVDAIYVGYIKRTSSSPYTWTNGGIGRLITKEDPDPANWVWSQIMDGIGSVTSAIARLQKNRDCFTTASNEGCLWLFFGTGRYYYAQETGIDDVDSQRRLFAIKEPCAKLVSENVEIDPTCSSSVSFAGLTDVTSIGSVPAESDANSASFKGWYINLDAIATGFGAERLVSDPLAIATGLVFFTTIKPYTDVCAIGGKSYIWALRYNTGGAPSSSSLRGVALLQVSTAAIEHLKLTEAFPEKGGRRTAAMEGLPTIGAKPLEAITTAENIPVERVIHMRER